MIFHIYLHNYVTDTLEMFGDLNNVINDIVDEAVKGTIPMESLPPAPTRSHDNCRQYMIDVTNTEYLQLVSDKGYKNKTVSLRRILYYFVDNELYNELGWSQKHDYEQQEVTKYQLAFAKAVTAVSKLYKLCNNTQKQTLLKVLAELRGLKDGT